MTMKRAQLVFFVLLIVAIGGTVLAAGGPPDNAPDFPPALESYNDQNLDGILAILGNRIRQQPFNLVASLIFLAAIVHTFLTGRFMAISHRWSHDHEEKIKNGQARKG